MADQSAPHTANESNSKGFRNRLKKVFRRPGGTPPSHSTLPPTDPALTVSTTTTDPKEDPVYSEVRYTRFALYPTHHPLTDRLTQPQRCQLNDPSTFL